MARQYHCREVLVLPPWRHLEDVDDLGTWFSGGLVSACLVVRFNVLKGFFLKNSMVLCSLMHSKR